MWSRLRLLIESLSLANDVYRLSAADQRPGSAPANPPEGQPDRCRMDSGLRRNDESRSPDFLAGFLGEIVDFVCREGEPLGRLPQRFQTGQVAVLEQL